MYSSPRRARERAGALTASDLAAARPAADMTPARTTRRDTTRHDTTRHETTRDGRDAVTCLPRPESAELPPRRRQST
eukprot:scaffold7243_cov394-Prasinococcus_capsulatus_cf.AAC.22